MSDTTRTDSAYVARLRQRAQQVQQDERRAERAEQLSERLRAKADADRAAEPQARTPRRGLRP